METKNIEHKISWRDEYLKWIGGFANARADKLIIGANDNGDITGLLEAEKLPEDISNKVKDMPGIMVEVNKYTRQEQDYFEITVDPYPLPR
jgi:Predicted transcriptional regulator containing an HTH domain and an uncharacterized domain shared with the mammalian protein Schlafen